MKREKEGDKGSEKKTKRGRKGGEKERKERQHDYRLYNALLSENIN